MGNLLFNLVISCVVAFGTAFAASYILKTKAEFTELLIIGAAGTVFGYAISWVLTTSGIAEFALTATSTFLGACIFIYMLRFMKKK